MLLLSDHPRCYRILLLVVPLGRWRTTDSASLGRVTPALCARTWYIYAVLVVPKGYTYYSYTCYC